MIWEYEEKCDVCPCMRNALAHMSSVRIDKESLVDEKPTLFTVKMSLSSGFG